MGAWLARRQRVSKGSYQFTRQLPDRLFAPETAPGLVVQHSDNGNQNYVSTPVRASLTEDQISRRRALIDQLLTAPVDPATLQALQRARTALTTIKPGN